MSLPESVDGLAKLRVLDLKEILQKHGQTTSGNKAELVHRLTEYMNSQSGTNPASDPAPEVDADKDDDVVVNQPETAGAPQPEPAAPHVEVALPVKVGVGWLGFGPE